MTLLPVLEAMPGWPAAPAPALLDSLMVIVIIPVVISVIVVALGMGRTWLDGR